jgi:hypothetical protein
MTCLGANSSPIAARLTNSFFGAAGQIGSAFINKRPHI